ncbi:hypothetical protein AB0K71_06025 [Streptomyces syringium]|uniref:hypothetical protein n=1 Tax=Streptomyces syringium TaxID=76729 RepID=UPI003427C3C8
MSTPALPTEEQARALTDRIKIAVEGTWQLICEAYTSRTWAALGYDSWDAYCAAEFATAHLQLPREKRQEVVGSMRDRGLSLRAIASAIGTSPATAMRDAAVSDETPAVVTGTDGRTYPAHRPPGDDANIWVEPGVTAATERPESADRAPRRRPLPEALNDAGRDLGRAAERLSRLADDDRFAQNREVALQQMPEFLASLEHTVRLVQALNLPASNSTTEARRWWATSLRHISDTLAGIAHSLNQEQP